MRLNVYRVATVVIIGECVTGGVLDLSRQTPFYPVLIDLGYPSYFATILGTAKLLAAAVLLTPGHPRLKEWAYAGILINMVGACASHLAAGDPPTSIIAPGAFAVVALASWGLRPGSITKAASGTEKAHQR
jgi:DoxX-like family